MTFRQALEEMSSFWPGGLPIGSGTPVAVDRLQSEYGRQLPAPLRHYIAEVLPRGSVYFRGIGNPLRLWGADRLSPRLLGYNTHALTGAPLEDWNRSWFIVGDIGADPVVLDLDDTASGDEATWPVLTAAHGIGEWTFDVVADSLPQFVLLSAALHHALENFGEEAIEDDGQGFRLATPAADWLFPRFRRWAPQHSAGWLSVFGNY